MTVEYDDLVRRFAGLVAVALTACRVLDDGHCANAGGDATCRARGVGLDHCDRCVAHDDGCVAEPPSTPGCAVAGMESTSVAESGDDSGTVPADASTTTTATTTTTTTTEDASTTSAASSSTTDGDASSSTSPPGPTCGDGVVEGDEACDGAALAGQDCAGLPEFAGGTLACGASCELDTRACTPCLGATAPCGSDTECCSESCSGLGLCL